MNKEKSKNPISERSKKWITSALMELMKVKSYSEITIKEISSKADLVRRTFYRNFSSKGDILNYYGEQIANEFKERLAKHENLTIPDIVSEFFYMCNDHMDVFVKLKENKILFFTINQYEILYKFIIEKMRTEKDYQYPEEYIEYYAEYISGGLWNIFCRWVGDGAKKTPEEMIRFVNDIVERMKIQHSVVYTPPEK